MDVAVLDGASTDGGSFAHDVWGADAAAALDAGLSDGATADGGIADAGGVDGGGVDGGGDVVGTGGSGTDGSGTDGGGTDGSGTDGSGTDDAGTVGGGTDSAGTDGGGVDGAADGGDVLTEDTSPAEDIGPDEGCPGGAACPCVSPEDCFSGICAEGSEGPVCAQPCEAGCDVWQRCVAVEGGPDAALFCVDAWARLCSPCLQSEDCNPPGTTEARCLDGGSAGSTCGVPCDQDGDCPSGYACRDTADVEGDSASQCVPVDDVGAPIACACTANAVALGLITPCSGAPAQGEPQLLCAGEARCVAVGEAPVCEVAAPGAEVCDGADNDCDGLVDEASCDDGNLCTTDSCDPATGCVHQANVGPCSDGDVCTLGDQCAGAVCVAGAPGACDDGDVCTDDGCDPAVGCLATENAAPCDDGDACTALDACTGGVCAGAPLSCDDDNPCTVESCDPAQGCQATAVADETECGAAALASWCLGGQCVAKPVCGDGVVGWKEACDDGNLVDDDTCSASCERNPFPSCGALRDRLPGTPDGVYAIDPDGAGPIEPVNLFCDMAHGGWTLVGNYDDTPGDDMPNDTSYVVSGWQQTASGAWDAQATAVTRAWDGSGSAAVSLAFVQALGRLAGQRHLKMCFVHEDGHDTSCRSSDDGSLTLVGHATGNPKLTPLQGDALAYTFGRLGGLAATVDGYDYAAYQQPDQAGGVDGVGCVPRSPDADGVHFLFGVTASLGLCEHPSVPGTHLQGVWHGEGGGSSYRPSSSDDDELGAAAPTDPSVPLKNPTPEAQGFRLYVGPPAPTVGAGDYTTWYWPTNHRPVETWPAVQPVMHFVTGHYALALDESTGALESFGWLTDGLGAEEALLRPNADVTALPSAELRFEAGAPADGIVATTFLGASDSPVDRAQMIDGGRLMNRVQIPTVSYAADPALSGSIMVASMPRHVVFTHTVQGATEAAKVARISLGGDAVAGLTDVAWLAPGRAVRLTGGTGEGWIFVVADDGQHTLSVSPDGTVVAERAVASAPAEGVSVSLTAVPTLAVTPAELALYVDPPSAAQVTYTLLDLAGTPVSAPVDVPWDPTLGAFRVTLGTLKAAGAPQSADYEQEPFHTWYGRHRIEVARTSVGPLSVPLALHGAPGVSWYIVGGVPILRDEQGSPLGIPVQISKNWHGASWYHFYAQPTLSGPGPDRMELTVASSRWGETYAASHAQLSLIGWNAAGGHWDESALGAFGESITYDPDVTLQRSMVDDVRPFLVQSKAKWSWTGNVGGADFLRYATAAEPAWERRLARVRSLYEEVGPTATNVVYAGVSRDGRIRAHIRSRLVGTDDLVRVYYHLDYTFLEDVEYDRLAFFQVAADHYADNGFARYAYGDADGVVLDEAVPDHKTTGYASDADRGIPLPGEAPWVMLYDNQRDWDDLPEHYANVGFVVRAFEATIGDTVLTTPHINITRTNNAGSQMAFQLGLPHEAGSPWCGAPCQGKQRFVPAGSRVRATVEYLVPPADKSRYYGASAWLQAMAPELFDTPEMMRRLAADNRQTVAATLGAVRDVYPVQIDTALGQVAADLTLGGGLGRTAMTFHGLSRHDGWQLQRLVQGAWAPVDQSVHGNDFWQTTYDPDRRTWSLTWSVANEGTQRYRVVWAGVGWP